MTLTSQTSTALTQCLARARETTDDVGGRFPLFADPDTGRWKTSRRGSWMGGYWVGLLWLLAIVDGDEDDRVRAAQWTERLARQASRDTVTRGMTFWYGAAVGHVLTGDHSARDVAVGGARALAEAFDPALGVVSTGLGLGAAWSPVAMIDGVVGLVPLLAWAAQRDDDARLREVAERHAERHLELCLLADGSIRAHADPDGPSEGQHVPAAHWARGQAWGMLAFSQAAQWLSDSYVVPAAQAADWWLDHAPVTRAAPADLDAPDGLVDTSASAVAAVALLRLAELEPGSRERYRAAALQIVETLTTHHLTPLDAADSRSPGILLDGCYDPPTASAHELIWGSFFLVHALSIAGGWLDPCAL